MPICKQNILHTVESAFCSKSAPNWATQSPQEQIEKLCTAIQSLNIQIRTTFTVLKFDLLSCLEDEGDSASQTSSESEDDGESSQNNSDSDDDGSATSSLIAESQSHPELDHILSSPRRKGSPSADKALSRLERICSLLEARVNYGLVPAKTQNSDQYEKYPRLSQLKEYLSPSSTRPVALAFIPYCGSASSQFLFDIAEDTMTAKAFVAFADPDQKQPNKETRRQMLDITNNLAQHFLIFNNFVNKLQLSSASLSRIAVQPKKKPAMESSLPMAAQLHRFRLQLATAYRAILSHVRSCNRTTPENHEILLQLPGKEHVAAYEQGNIDGCGPVQIFFTLCSAKDWQFAKMSFLLPGGNRTCRQAKLCDALHSSYINDTDLEFYVSEDWMMSDHEEIPIQIPIKPPTTRTYPKSFPMKDSLRVLIDGDLFANQMTLSMLLNTGEGTVIGIDKRKALAIKLVLGFMVSIESEFQAWDPESIYFLENNESEHMPFVSVPGRLDSEVHRKGLSLEGLSLAGSINETEDYLKPIPQFTSLAMILLEILLGQRPPRQIARQSQLLMTSWKSLRRTIDMYVKEVATKAEVNREVFPFLQAAQGCLDFHLEYQYRILQAKSRKKIDVAWEVVFDTILSNIDDRMPRNIPIKEHASSNHSISTPGGIYGASSSLSPEKHANPAPGEDEVECMTQNVRLATAQSSQTNILLFDSKQASESTAPEFWTLLEKFHRSYSRYVSDRSTDKGEESSRRVRVAILDTGVDFDHPAIKKALKTGRLKKEWCQSWVGDKHDARDDDKHLHGTNCVTLLHKSSPEADIYVAKIFNHNSVRFYEAENIAKAIKHAADVWDVDIISMSFGLRRPEARVDEDKTQESLALKEYQRIVDDIENAILEASHNGRFFFAAASNDGMNKRRAFPANYEPHVFSVHASHGNGQDGGINPVADSSFQLMTLGMGIELSEKDWVHIGERRFPQYKTELKSGTSFATPIAAGIAATVLDLTSRVEAIEDRVRRKLRRPEGLKKVLRLMAKPNVIGGLCYMAPWLHWESGWETDESMARSSWDAINRQFLE